ncbi:TPA: hypothetical protein ACIZB4_001264 [Legionella pneumophila]|uniref:Uncharacterized protein n=4 Tax=Legionella TaxID=445 RepID=A0A222P376_9GAMM|nr:MULTISPECIES: hypothetical protein [Legionella]AMP90311.1 hypothetical protein AXF35_11675 [Legionella pneumophila subsp. pascullei]AMP92022.1 hypothetical protein AXF36_05125 [Legionella pneumophila subsp. pascullei]AMP94987.1 hypothetical protein AXF37_05015 [Legionella pneumophila subsp. pascullei]AMV13740.1 hypothetical protein ULM_10570 [Legionella pneumophila]ANH12415.1 hypothetical protein A5478_05035 [Legionella pneumophila]
MIKHYIRSSIIVLIQTVLPIIALLAIAPWFINSNLLTRWQSTFTTIQPLFLGLHGVLYLSLVLLWPRLILRLQNQHQITTEQLNTALKTRWYLLGIFVFIDILMIGGKL